MADAAVLTDPLAPHDLANAVTAFCTMLGGLVPLLLCALVRPQGWRWHLAYLSIFVTGIPTLGWHGWGGGTWHVLDIGTNLLVAWAVPFAVLGQDFEARVAKRVAAVSGVVNLVAVGQMLLQVASGSNSLAVSFGGSGGYYMGELVLIADAFGVVVLFVLSRHRRGLRASRLLRAVTLAFLLGLGLSTANGDVVTLRVLSLHALWHVVGAFGFVLLWAYNHVRLEEQVAAPAV